MIVWGSVLIGCGVIYLIKPNMSNAGFGSERRSRSGC